MIVSIETAFHELVEKQNIAGLPPTIMDHIRTMFYAGAAGTITALTNTNGECAGALMDELQKFAIEKGAGHRVN